VAGRAIDGLVDQARQRGLPRLRAPPGKGPAARPKASKAQVATAVLSGFVSATGVQWGNRLLLLIGSIAVNTLTIAATYHWLSTRRPTWRQLAPGAVGLVGARVVEEREEPLLAMAEVVLVGDRAVGEREEQLEVAEDEALACAVDVLLEEAEAHLGFLEVHDLDCAPEEIDQR